jgi:hypothetical protein
VTSFDQLLWKIRETRYAAQKATVDSRCRSCESRDPGIGWNLCVVTRRASVGADGFATTSLLHALTIDMLETGTEVVNVWILIEDTQTLVDHVWSQRSFGELRKSSSKLPDDGVEGVVAGVKNTHGMVVSTVPFLGQGRGR